MPAFDPRALHETQRKKYEKERENKSFVFVCHRAEDIVYVTLLNF